MMGNSADVLDFNTGYVPISQTSTGSSAVQVAVGSPCFNRFRNWLEVGSMPAGTNNLHAVFEIRSQSRCRSQACLQ